VWICLRPYNSSFDVLTLFVVLPTTLHLLTIRAVSRLSWTDISASETTVLTYLLVYDVLLLDSLKVLSLLFSLVFRIIAYLKTVLFSCY